MTTINSPQFTENWYGDEKLAVLRQVLAEIRSIPGELLEIGCWEGKSTIEIANDVYPRTLACVDHFKGDLTSPPGWGVSPELAASRDVHSRFLSNMDAATKGNYHLYRMDWIDYAQMHDRLRYAFVHLDGAHDYESVRLQLAWFVPHMSRGGILCGDDYQHPDVQQALNDYPLGVWVKDQVWWWKA